MDFSLEEIIKLSEEVAEFNEINPSDIPCIDLYMDQVTTFFEDKLKHLKRNEEETILTKTMINNYSKAKILTPIKNKKYDKNQMILLLLIYNLKQILSLEDIKILLSPIIEEINSSNTTNSLEDLYKAFLSTKKSKNLEFLQDVKENINLVSSNTNFLENNALSEKSLISIILTLISTATLQKRLAEKLIDTYFKDR